MCKLVVKATRWGNRGLRPILCKADPVIVGRTWHSVSSMLSSGAFFFFQNVLHDSLQTFHEVSHNLYLERTDFILFLNKHDMFIEKLKTTRFQTCMKDYTGD